jgi:hypothetical protein
MLLFAAVDFLRVSPYLFLIFSVLFGVIAGRGKNLSFREKRVLSVLAGVCCVLGISLAFVAVMRGPSSD